MFPACTYAPLATQTGRLLFEDDLYFLDMYGKIVAARAADSSAVGRHFFDLYPMPKAEHALFRKFLANYGSDLALFRAGRRSVLFLTSFYVETGCVAAVLPRGPIAKLLNGAGGLAESFYPLFFSNGVIACGDPPSEEHYTELRRYLHPYLMPLCPDMEADFVSASALARSLGTIARQIGKITGCTVDCRFDALGLILPQRMAPERMVGVLFLLCLTARRAAKRRSLVFFAETMGSNPTECETQFELLDTNDPLPELEVLRQTAHYCDFGVDILKEGALVTVRFELALREFSKQIAKRPIPYKP